MGHWGVRCIVNGFGVKCALLHRLVLDCHHPCFHLWNGTVPWCLPSWWPMMIYGTEVVDERYGQKEKPEAKTVWEHFCGTMYHEMVPTLIVEAKWEHTSFMMHMYLEGIWAIPKYNCMISLFIIHNKNLTPSPLCILYFWSQFVHGHSVTEK